MHSELQFKIDLLFTCRGLTEELVAHGIIKLVRLLIQDDPQLQPFEIRIIDWIHSNVKRTMRQTKSSIRLGGAQYSHNVTVRSEFDIKAIIADFCHQGQVYSKIIERDINIKDVNNLFKREKINCRLRIRRITDKERTKLTSLGMRNLDVLSGYLTNIWKDRYRALKINDTKFQNYIMPSSFFDQDESLIKIKNVKKNNVDKKPYQSLKTRAQVPIILPSAPALKDLQRPSTNNGTQNKPRPDQVPEKNGLFKRIGYVFNKLI